MIVRLDSICNEIINFLGTQGIDATYSLTPEFDSTQGGSQWYVTPLASEIERTGRDGCSYNVTVQVLACKYLGFHDMAAIQSMLDLCEDIKGRLIGGVIAEANGEWCVDNVASSGTQFLSSSSLRGGVIDSRELEERYILQIPIILALRSN